MQFRLKKHKKNDKLVDQTIYNQIENLHIAIAI